MLRVISDSLSAELGGTHWGLLPALLGYYWLITWGGLGVMPTGMWLLLASLVASYDLADRRIPNVLNIWIAVAGLTYQATSAGLAALPTALLAGLIGFGLMSIFFFFGAVGGGDVKALGALATFLSPWGAVNLFILTTFAGGLLALVLFLPAIIRWVSEGMVPGEIRQYTKRMSMPYGLAIFGGVLAMIL